MNENEAQRLALEESQKRGGDFAYYAGKEDGWYYFACGWSKAPHYSSLPWVLRINELGKIEKLKGLEIRQEVSNKARKLKLQKDFT